MTYKSRDRSIDDMIMIAAAVNTLTNLAKEVTRPTPVDPSVELERQNKWHNRWQNVKILLGVYKWQYAFLPLGIYECPQPYCYGNAVLWVKTKNLHVFGFRIARWVFKSKTVNYTPTRVARLRLRPPGRKPGRKLRKLGV